MGPQISFIPCYTRKRFDEQNMRRAAAAAAHLHVFNARVNFGENKQNSLDDLPMRLADRLVAFIEYQKLCSTC